MSFNLSLWSGVIYMLTVVVHFRVWKSNAVILFLAFDELEPVSEM